MSTTYKVSFGDDGATRWYDYRTNKLHRTGGPAVTYANGTLCYFKHGLRHRLDGPAMILQNEIKKWFIAGREYTEAEFNTQKKS